MLKKILLLLLTIALPLLGESNSFTIASYNMGSLPGGYDYLRAAAMQKLVQERYQQEPEWMANIEKIQKAALKTLFTNQEDPNHDTYKTLFANPTSPDSSSYPWYIKSLNLLTFYDVHPTEILDPELNQILSNYIVGNIKETRQSMVKKILHHYLKYDIIAVQEADEVDPAFFPETHHVVYTNKSASIDGIAWRKERFDLLQVIDKPINRSLVVKLFDKETRNTIAIVSTHLTGCNAFVVVNNDSEKGDLELERNLTELEGTNADIKIIAMDSNVTATHPRLKKIKDAGYKIDFENFLEPTCTNPWHILNTRIDWIAIQSPMAKITNIPVLNVNLNSIETNISDHKPIAAKIIMD